MKEKKDNSKMKPMAKTSNGEREEEQTVAISSRADLKNFLTTLRDKLADHSAPALYAVTAMQHVFGLPGIYDLLDKPNREIARDIWLRLRQGGMQLSMPPMLFSPDEDVVQGN